MAFLSKYLITHPTRFLLFSCFFLTFDIQSPGKKNPHHKYKISDLKSPVSRCLGFSLAVLSCRLHISTVIPSVCRMEMPVEVLLTFAPRSSAVFHSSFCLSPRPLSFPAELVLSPGVSCPPRPSSSPPPSSPLPRAKTQEAGRFFYVLAVRYCTYSILIQNNDPCVWLRFRQQRYMREFKSLHLCTCPEGVSVNPSHLHGSVRLPVVCSLWRVNTQSQVCLIHFAGIRF